MMPHTPDPVEADALARVILAGDTLRSDACEHPIRMVGSGLLVEADTGRILHRHTGDGAAITVRCRNRRASVCRACSALYRLDAYHLVAAGLRGGKDTPAVVGERPRLFVTLTAPSFGTVHLGPAHDGTPRRCHHERRKGANACGRWHLTGDPAIGTPLDPKHYDYTGQVLFNAHAGLLWRRLTIEVRRALARTAGLSRKKAHAQVRVVFAKVAEFQTRGCVHYHAIVRLDGPDGPGSAPPDWATVEVLETAIRHAAGTVHLASPATATVAARDMRWGRHLDIQHLPSDDPDGSDVAIARYVAKYATKAAEFTGVTIAALFCRSCNGLGVRDGRDREEMLCRVCGGSGRRPGVNLSDLPAHGQALVQACWQLGGIRAFASLRLRRWAHQAGYRGHVTTKSRSYSTTFAALRSERGEYNIARHAQSLGIDPNARQLIAVGDWRYVGDALRTPDPSLGGGRP
ncbi:replication initiator [Luedemannella helvata]|uniref:Replication initiator protein RepSA n=1 Tax=Luedemannella helvata TaxID=349315 RepID=A0ABP4X1D8_9ACTN